MLAAILSKIGHFTPPQPEPYHCGHSANLAEVHVLGGVNVCVEGASSGGTWTRNGV
jgi:hypothetical protein